MPEETTFPLAQALQEIRRSRVRAVSPALLFLTALLIRKSRVRAADRALILLAALLGAHTRVGAEKNAVALTFDDGPDRELEDFLKLLEGAGARGTFFVVGEHVERDPGKLREIVSRGHEVAVHCYHHRNHLHLSPRQTVDDMRRAKAVIEDASERATRCFRPPGGMFNATSWIEASRQGWERVLWSRSGRDWSAQATLESVAQRIGRPEAGDVILLHDSNRYAAPGSRHATLGALPIILETLSSLEFQVRPVGELLNGRRR
ncbi:MAG: polysaccharide deacetylase family protein [Actinomycetota bacterium]|nr:polysaccharide deacetylase family protein [Actinomycetota bacterium]